MPQGQNWTLAPHTSGLSAAEGGFETPLGWFGASWTRNGKNIKISVDTPRGTTGTLTLPSSVGKTVKVDGKLVKLSKSGLPTITVSGGNHTITTS